MNGYFSINDKTLTRIVVSRSELDLGAIKIAFQAKYGKSLESRIKVCTWNFDFFLTWYGPDHNTKWLTNLTHTRYATMKFRITHFNLYQIGAQSDQSRVNITVVTEQVIRKW